MSYYSKSYDALFGDQEATKRYLQFLEKFDYQEPVLECACGSGDLGLLIQRKKRIDGLDFDKQMLVQAKAKGFSGDLYYRDMSLPWRIDSKYQSILCFGDSINYLKDTEQLSSFFAEVMKHLDDGGLFYFDVHSVDRLREFRDEYIEEAIVNGIPVQWTCISQDDHLYHQFVFYSEGFPVVEEVVQRVFSPQEISSLLKQIGFVFEVFTDFDQTGLKPGEKNFYVCQKEGKK